MAYFEQFDISPGWWFYFFLVCASNDKDFTDEFIQEMQVLIFKESLLDEQNDKKQKRVPLRKMRGQGY